MTKSNALTDAEVALLKTLTREVQNIRQSERTQGQEGEPHADTTIYVALPPDTGIPGRIDSTPGKVDCAIYRVINGLLEDTGLIKSVFNLSTIATSNTYLPIFRDAYGSWIASASSGSGGTPSVPSTCCCDEMNCAQPAVEFTEDKCKLCDCGIDPWTLDLGAVICNGCSVGGGHVLHLIDSGGSDIQCTWTSGIFVPEDDQCDTEYMWYLALTVNGAVLTLYEDPAGASIPLQSWQCNSFSCWCTNTFFRKDPAGYGYSLPCTGFPTVICLGPPRCGGPGVTTNTDCRGNNINKPWALLGGFSLPAKGTGSSVQPIGPFVAPGQFPTNMLVCLVTSDATSHSISTGWNTGVSAINIATSSDVRSSIFWRVADGTADDYPTVTFGAAVRYVTTVTSVRGQHEIVPIETIGDAPDDGAGFAPIPDMTTVNPNIVLVAVGGMLTNPTLYATGVWSPAFGSAFITVGSFNSQFYSAIRPNPGTIPPPHTVQLASAVGTETVALAIRPRAGGMHLFNPTCDSQPRFWKISIPTLGDLDPAYATDFEDCVTPPPFLEDAGVVSPVDYFPLELIVDVDLVVTGCLSRETIGPSAGPFPYCKAYIEFSITGDFAFSHPFSASIDIGLYDGNFGTFHRVGTYYLDWWSLVCDGVNIFTLDPTTVLSPPLTDDIPPTITLEPGTAILEGVGGQFAQAVRFFWPNGSRGNIIEGGDLLVDSNGAPILDSAGNPQVCTKGIPCAGAQTCGGNCRYHSANGVWTLIIEECSTFNANCYCPAGVNDVAIGQFLDCLDGSPSYDAEADPDSYVWCPCLRIE